MKYRELTKEEIKQREADFSNQPAMWGISFIYDEVIEQLEESN